jgi:hypothetical protein
MTKRIRWLRAGLGVTFDTIAHVHEYKFKFGLKIKRITTLLILSMLNRN